MRADRHPGIDELFSNLGMPAGGLADFKERCLETFVLERLDYGQGADRPGSIVEGQNDFFVAEKIVSSQSPSGKFGFMTKGLQQQGVGA